MGNTTLGMSAPLRGLLLAILVAALSGVEADLMAPLMATGAVLLETRSTRPTKLAAAARLLLQESSALDEVDSSQPIESISSQYGFDSPVESQQSDSSVEVPTKHADCVNEKPYKSGTECVKECFSGATPNENGFCTTCDSGEYADHLYHKCVLNCPAGSVKNVEHADCVVCDEPSGLRLFADHEGKACVSECPTGTIKHVIDTDGDGSPDLFDCKRCGLEQGEQGEQTFADRLGKQCVTSCPAGTVKNGFTHDCDVCGKSVEGAQQLYADHMMSECVVRCPLGTVGNEETRDCISCLEGEFADHASNVCVEYSGRCPIGTEAVTALEEPGDCKNICRDQASSMLLFDTAASGDPEEACSGISCCVSECTSVKAVDANDICQENIPTRDRIAN